MLITIFNRREVLITFDVSKYNEAKRDLSDAGIRYTCKTSNMTSSSYLPDSRHRGVPGINYDQAYEYKIFVHRDDYERAVHLIR